MTMNPHTDIDQAESCLCMCAFWKQAILANDGNVGCFHYAHENSLRLNQVSLLVLDWKLEMASSTKKM